MPSCAFLKCSKHSRKNNKSSGVTYHAFPQDELWKHKWLEVVRKQRRDAYWMATKHSRLCSKHFRPTDTYKTDKGFIRIVKAAVPYFVDTIKEEATDTLSRSDSPNSLQNVNISDLDSMFDSTRVAYLKSKMLKVVKEKKQLQSKNKNLKRRNERLIEKCKSLKARIVQLKKALRRPRTSVKPLSTNTNHNMQSALDEIVSNLDLE